MPEIIFSKKEFWSKYRYILGTALGRFSQCFFLVFVVGRPYWLTFLLKHLLWTWTYFNDVNGSKDLNLKKSFLWAATKKMKQNWERQKNKEKENDSDESDFSENEIPDLNSLRPFKFEPKEQISEVLSVVAVMMRMRVLNMK